jgi:ribosomal peptide maturation radical SAM protein 1
MVGDDDAISRRITREDVPSFLDESLRLVDWSRYMAVGFTTTFSQSLSSLLLALRIKQNHPHVRTVFGGAGVDSEVGVEFLRAFPWVDYVVHGEAELSFPELLTKIADGNTDFSVPGVSLRSNGSVASGAFDDRPHIDLNKSPIPDFTDYFRELKRTGVRSRMAITLPFESSRGCWWGAKHHCAFCGLNGRAISYRTKAPDRVQTELLELSHTYRQLAFAATDNVVPMEYCKTLFPQLRNLDLDLTLFYEVTPHISYSQLATMSAAGVKYIQPGIETFSTRILKRIRKGTTRLQNVQLLRWCSELSVVPLWNLLSGFPGEDQRDYSDLPDLFRLICHLYPPMNFAPVKYERFSPYYERREEYGLTLRPAAVYDFIFPRSRVSLDQAAFLFERVYDNKDALTEENAAAVRAAWESWKQRWKSRRPFCYYEKGPDYLIIHDSRPESLDADWRYRRTYLHGVAAAIMLFCTEHRSFRSICLMATQRFEASEELARTAVSDLCSRGLLLGEEGRYVALAVRLPTGRDRLNRILPGVEHESSTSRMQTRMLPLVPPRSDLRV